MSEHDLLQATLERLFSEEVTRHVRQSAEAGASPDGLFLALSRNGLLHATASEAAGGAGGTLMEEFAVLRWAGRFAAPGPLAETMLAGRLISAAGRAIPDGALAFGAGQRERPLRLYRAGPNWKLDGDAPNVAWDAAAARIALLAQTGDGWALAILAPDGIRRTDHAAMSGEPRSDLAFRNFSLGAGNVALLPQDWDFRRAEREAALQRSALMAGALEAVLAMAVGYANDRIQFGRAIGKFQAVQQMLAQLAGEVAAALAIAEHACRTACLDPGAELPVAAAKARVGEAAGKGAAIAHQTFGAIGFTQEHDLHCYTRRLWTWRDEAGNEAYWQEKLGRAVLKAGDTGAGPWPAIAAI